LIGWSEVSASSLVTAAAAATLVSPATATAAAVVVAGVPALVARLGVAARATGAARLLVRELGQLRPLRVQQVVVEVLHLQVRGDDIQASTHHDPHDFGLNLLRSAWGMYGEIG
jgi:hypothetical protein